MIAWVAFAIGIGVAGLILSTPFFRSKPIAQKLWLSLMGADGVNTPIIVCTDSIMMMESIIDIIPVNNEIKEARVTKVTLTNGHTFTVHDTLDSIADILTNGA